VTQVLDDPAGHHDWTIRCTVDAHASDEEGRAVLNLMEVSRPT
jgi:hypothetical protein